MLNIRKEDCASALENLKIILFAPINQGFLNKLRFHIAFLLFGCITFFLHSCSQEKHTFVSKNFHNTTAHYNAYFLAREKMKEVDAQIIKSNVDDYNKILSVYPDRNEATVTSIKTPLEDVIKKASLINEKHKNSDWLDDSYVIIGKSYYYRHEFPTAIVFFKYVNSNSKDDIARHSALILLMRTYIDSADYVSAKAVSDYLNKKQEGGETLSDENAKDFLLTKAYYHQKLEDYNQMLPNLEKAAPLLSKRDEKARINFILGQLNQLQQNDSSSHKAYKHYRSTIRRNPPYDLLFHSKLYLTQVSESSKSSDKKRLDRYFKRLLKDKKNSEYKDKIYYEMARYELKKGNSTKAITHLEKSLSANPKNIPQKGLSYLSLGEIYYDKENFDQSKLYYDSAVTVWSKTDKRFKPISSRQKILAEFVGYKQTVQREDSLQRLAKLPKDALDKHIDLVIAQEQESAKQLAIKKELAAKVAAAQNTDTQNPDNPNSTFPLTNPSAIVSGKKDFVKIWGMRKLEDNWRRSQKDNFDFSEDKTKDPIVNNTKDTVKVDTVAKVVNKEIYYKDIPVTQAQIDTSNKRIENALYCIGKIYYQKLNEPNNSIKSFDDLMKRFPQSEHIAEIYYTIYLIYKNKKDDKNMDVFRYKVLNEYPTSLYAKLLKNPNYIQDNKLANQQAHLKYKDVFDLYKSGSYKSADSLIKVIRIEFPDNDIDDKLSLLNIMIVGQTSNAVVYKNQLNEFLQNYSNSPLAPKAKEMLAASDVFINKSSESGLAINVADAKYSTELNKPHFLVAVFPVNVSDKKIMGEFKNYHMSNSQKELNAEYVALSDTTYMVVVKSFQEKFPAQVYLNNLKNEKSFYKDHGYTKYPVFIITNHNYQLFLEKKHLEGYLKFYKEKY